MSDDTFFALLRSREQAHAALLPVTAADEIDEAEYGRLCRLESIATYAALTFEPTTPAGFAAFAELGLTLCREIQREHEDTGGLADWALGAAAGTEDDRTAEEIFLATLASATRNVCAASTAIAPELVEGRRQSVEERVAAIAPRIRLVCTALKLPTEALEAGLRAADLGGDFSDVVDWCIANSVSIDWILTADIAPTFRYAAEHLRRYDQRQARFGGKRRAVS